MVRFQIDDISEDMVLGESIVLPTGELLLGAGFRIKKRYKDRLREMGFQNLLIQVEGTEEVTPGTTVSEANQREMLTNLSTASKDLTKTFDHVRQSGHKAVEEMIHENRTHLSKFIMNTGLQAALDKFMDEIMGQQELVLNLSALQQTSEALFAHTMNVTITSLCLGRKFRFSYEELKQLGIGALNYDLGLVTIPKEIFDKPGDLTEQEREAMRQHTVFGFLMLSEHPSIPATSAAASLQHHEHQDGSGYPRAIKGDNRPPLKDFTRGNMIHRFAEIVAVADQYEMMISGRKHYCEKMPVQEAMKRLIQKSGTILNAEIVKTLISVVPIFPVGARIRILEAPTPPLIGYSGVVAKDNAKELDKPQIILYETKNHQKIKPFIIDTAVHTGFVLELI